LKWKYLRVRGLGASSDKESAMNGYQARVQRRRQLAAERAARTERDAVPQFDWLCGPLDGIVEAVGAAVPHRRGRAAKVGKSESAVEEIPAGDEPGTDNPAV
jgi:hypothetical protein